MTRKHKGRAAAPAPSAGAQQKTAGMNLILKLSIFGLIGLATSIGAQLLLS